MEVLDQSIVRPVLAPSRCQGGEFIALPFPASTGCSTVLEPSHVPSQQGSVNSSPYHTSLTLTFLPLSFTYKDPCDHIGSIQKIQSAMSVPPLLHNIFTDSQDQDPDIFFGGEGDYFAYHRNHPRGKHRGKNNYTHPSKSQMQANALEHSSSFP